MQTKMEDLPLPTLFEQARKIHSTATDSGADQVHSILRKLLSILRYFFVLGIWGFRVLNFLGNVGKIVGGGQEGFGGSGEMRGHGK